MMLKKEIGCHLFSLQITYNYFNAIRHKLIDNKGSPMHGSQSFVINLSNPIYLIISFPKRSLVFCFYALLNRIEHVVIE